MAARRSRPRQKASASLLRGLTVLVVLAFGLCAFASSGRPGQPPGALALESRLYAPCCYGGTLDTHESEVARELRAEIASRLARHESAESIQADFVSRFGQRVIAAKSDAPIRLMGLTVACLLLAVAAALALMLRRWVRAENPDSPVAPLDVKDPLDDRLDAELADMSG